MPRPAPINLRFNSGLVQIATAQPRPGTLNVYNVKDIIAWSLTFDGAIKVIVRSRISLASGHFANGIWEPSRIRSKINA